MDKQEKREKEIEEMENDICNGCKYYKGKDFCCICDVISYAKTLVDLHYRKEDEVQKETAEKILNELLVTPTEYRQDKIIEIAKIFGAEVVK